MGGYGENFPSGLSNSESESPYFSLNIGNTWTSQTTLFCWINSSTNEVEDTLKIGENISYILTTPSDTSVDTVYYKKRDEGLYQMDSLGNQGKEK